MLIKRIVEKTLGLKGHRVKSIKWVDKSILIFLDINKRYKRVCSVCGAKCPGYDKLKPRKWLHVPLWGMSVFLFYRPRRVKCQSCGIKVERMDWTRGKSPITKGLCSFLSRMSEYLAWKTVGDLFGFHWNTVFRAVKETVLWGLDHRKISTLNYLGIDEISRRKGHIYHTQVYNLETGTLLWTREGRKEEVLNSFFEQLEPHILKGIKAVCCDMWKAYNNAVKKHLPHATLVLDKFHVVRMLNQVLDQVRNSEHKKLIKQGNPVLKGSKYIWLKNPCNLTGKQKVRLKELEKLNLRINRAYILKEAFRLFWNCKDQCSAEKYLNQWFWWATHSRIEQMRKFAWVLRRHQKELLNYCEVPIDNGKVEGLNNKAKVISHRSYGFRTESCFRIALYHGMAELPQPILTHKFL